MSVGLIDETEIYNARIRKVNVEKLKSNSNVTRILEKGEKTTLEDYETREEFIFDTLKIEDKNKFNELVIGSKTSAIKDDEGNEVGKVKRDYIHMSLFVTDLEEGTTNITPLTKEQYEMKCDKIQGYIANEYGLDLNLEDKKFKLLALNRTFKMDCNVEDYYELFLLILLIAPKKYSIKNFILDGDNNVIGVYLENGLVRLKIYDKTKQLKNEKDIDIKEQLMRVEVVMKDVRKIKEIFGTTLVSAITDENMEIYFNYVLNEDIFSKIDDYLENSTKQLKKLAKEEKKRNK